MRAVRIPTAVSPRRVRAALIAVVVLVADQVTKGWARTTLADRDIDLIPGFLRLHLAENPGSAFSLFQSLGSWLGVAAILASGLIVVLVDRTGSRAELAGYSLILGGAVGNLADRLVKGRWLTGPVTDFIDFSFWPNFNVADSAITIGVVTLLWAANRSR